ncbi:MAG TPA: hypothetical protein VF163_01935 [Micromonosporaceae bacterium]
MSGIESATNAGSADGSAAAVAAGSADGSAAAVAARSGVRPRVQHLRLALPVCAVLLVVAMAAGWLGNGPLGAVGAGLGVALVAVSYIISTLVIAWADSINPRLVFPAGMGMYLTKFSLLGVMMIAVGGTDWPGRIPMAMGIVAAVVAWTGTQIWWTVHHEHPYVGPADPITPRH